MPWSQPAVRATALVCLVLRRSYVSNSASPVADWGLKVILQPPYRQRKSIRPPCLRRTESHAENPIAKARSMYWRRAFVVPSTCVRRATGHVSIRRCACLYLSGPARRRCVEGTTHVRRTYGHILPAQSIYNELITGIPEKISSTLLNTVKTHQLTWHGTPGDWDCPGCISWQRNSAEETLSWPWALIQYKDVLPV